MPTLNGTHTKITPSVETCDQGLFCLVPDSLGLERDFELQWLSAQVVVLVTTLKFSSFSFVAISTSLENNKNLNEIFSGDFDFSSRAVFF